MKKSTTQKNIFNLILFLALFIFSNCAFSKTTQNKNIEMKKQEQVEKFRRFQSLNSEEVKLTDYEYIEKKHNTDRTKFLEKNN